MVQLLLREATRDEPPDRGEVSIRTIFILDPSHKSDSFTPFGRQGGGFSSGDQHQLRCQGDGDATSGEREQ